MIQVPSSARVVLGTLVEQKQLTRMQASALAVCLSLQNVARIFFGYLFSTRFTVASAVAIGAAAGVVVAGLLLTPKVLLLAIAVSCLAKMVWSEISSRLAGACRDQSAINFDIEVVLTAVDTCFSYSSQELWGATIEKIQESRGQESVSPSMLDFVDAKVSSALAHGRWLKGEDLIQRLPEEFRDRYRKLAGDIKAICKEVESGVDDVKSRVAEMCKVASQLGKDIENSPALRVTLVRGDIERLNQYRDELPGLLRDYFPELPAENFMETLRGKLSRYELKEGPGVSWDYNFKFPLAYAALEFIKLVEGCQQPGEITLPTYHGLFKNRHLIEIQLKQLRKEDCPGSASVPPLLFVEAARVVQTGAFP